MKLPKYPALIACVLALGVCDAQSAGVAVLKDQVYHRDLSAKAIAYSRIIDSHGPYLSLVRGNSRVNILRSMMVSNVEVADGIPATIIEEKDISQLRETLENLKQFSARFSQSSALLKPQIEALTAHISRFDAGDVRFEDLWISKAELKQILETRVREYNASEFAEVEKRVYEGGQRDKGLVFHDGKWMTSEETSMIPAESRTQLSDSIEPLWNGDLESAKISVESLRALAAKQRGAPKIRTERLINVVRNLFLAEMRLNQRTIASTRESYEAFMQEKNAKEWLKPNGFGTIHHDAHRASLEKAAEIRQRSAERLEKCRQELRNQLHECEVLAGDFLKIKEKRVAMILGTTLRAVSARNCPEGDFQPSLTSL